MWIKSSALGLFLLVSSSEAGCPFMQRGAQPGNRTANWMHEANPHTEEGRRLLSLTHRKLAHQPRNGDYGIPDGGFAAVREDLKEMLVNSQDFWPADFEPPIGPHYGGLMIRLAWHCSGSYRDSDGRGGCDGGRIRFPPELTWMDNGNLDKALQLLEPIKEKYGSKLSWGDLIILAGNTAIESMGGPVLGFCGGRIDDGDGSNSLILGPSDIQEELSPCQSIDLQGQCQSPLGPTTVGLIYVNPEGPVTAPGDPVASGVDVRNAFARMGFNDTETVALVGGGHAFGKCHGACPDPPCGEEPLLGKGPNTYTAGFEGAWTTIPTTWSNQYFSNLLNLNWTLGTGPGGLTQWSPNADIDIIMLTSDVALKADPIYEPISQHFASNLTDLEHHFAHAWYRLTTGDMGPRERCLNEDPEDIPPAQPWQHQLPLAVSAVEIDYVSVRSLIQQLIDEDSANIPAFAKLAKRCAATYRDTDYRGGCNGARIRFPPESEWPENSGTQETLATLEPVKEAYPALSYADLIVLAGQTAIEAAGGNPMNFCGGRVDAMDAEGSESLAPRYYDPPVVSIRDDMQVKGLTPREGVALFARPTAGAPLNQFFIDLLAGTANVTSEEEALLEEEFLPIVEEFAEYEKVFLVEFANGWTHMMTSDRYDGPAGNICSDRVDQTLETPPFNAPVSTYGVPDEGFDAVREDIREVLVNSQDFFPADFEPPIGPNYGGLMIRLAWHCSGSYRESDGRGGCDGGRIRFSPELTWMDNGNLDKALQLLEPIKQKYGSKLSWGDLIVLAGNTAIESMGGPILGFCGGRVDAIDGSESFILGPSKAQEELSPCLSVDLQGQCPSPLGPTTIGLIYVNPEGPIDAPGDPVASGVDVRNAFARMGFNDTETVALVGGGHAFGKCHGACPDPPCGEEPLVGIGPNTYTSGFEGAWTTIPTTWSNQYFNNLFDLEWTIGQGAGGFIQWFPSADLDIMMLTTDIAMSADPDYEPISRNFAANLTDLEVHFAHAWYRLTSADMGPRERCLNDNPDDIPPAQGWQQPLPSVTTGVEVDYIPIRSMLQELIDEDSNNIAAFTNLAYQCAATFRSTDYKGGCNGARIRFPPESEWPENAGTADALATLDPVKEAYPEISYSDLIVLAGQTAIEAAGGKKMPFCGGRVDAMDAAGSEILAPRYYEPPVVSIRDDMYVKGLSKYEGVALFARPSGAPDGSSVARALEPNALSNQYFIDLMNGEGSFSSYELALLEDEFMPIVQEYAANEAKFKDMFAMAWNKMMTADRFDGPVGSICDGQDTPTLRDSDTYDQMGGAGAVGGDKDEDDDDEDVMATRDNGSIESDESAASDALTSSSTSLFYPSFFFSLWMGLLVGLVAHI